MLLTEKVAPVTGVARESAKLPRNSSPPRAKAVGVLSHSADEVDAVAEEIRQTGGEGDRAVADVAEPTRFSKRSSN